MSNIKSILFVCTGNSCRSVMAEGLMKKYLKELGKTDIKVSSAGIRSLNNMSPTEETKNVLQTEDVTMDGFKSRNVTADMIKEADLVLVMEELHKNEVLKIVPDAANKTYLLKEYGRTTPLGDEEWSGILDPIGRPMEFYKYCLNSIKREVDRIARIL